MSPRDDRPAPLIPSDASAPERLRAAAALIRTDGHVRGVMLGVGTGGRCAVGAVLGVKDAACNEMWEIQHHIDEGTSAVTALYALHVALSPRRLGHCSLDSDGPFTVARVSTAAITNWNDDHASDGEEVAAALEKAAAWAEEQGLS